MELHSYAKRRASKKWTIEQKRKLVEARIKYDHMFTNTPTTSVTPWKMILNLAKLDDFNVFFVRRQWSTMVAKYKQYKNNRQGNVAVAAKSIDDDMIRKITCEWEFFEPIHRYMARKTANLHSYALTKQEDTGNGQEQAQTSRAALLQAIQQQADQQQQPRNSASSPDRVNVYSSDTNEDFVMGMDVKVEFPAMLNTDHDFYSKKSAQPLNYFADASEDTQESGRLAEFAAFSNQEVVHTQEFIMEATNTAAMPTMEQTHSQQVASALLDNEKCMEQVIKTEPIDQVEVEEEPQGCSSGQQTVPAPPIRQTTHAQQEVTISERDKYYRHKRRFNRRVEHRFDALLNAFGQIVKSEYPNIKLHPLLETAVDTGGTVLNRLFSSDSSSADNLTSDEETPSKPTAQHG